MLSSIFLATLASTVALAAPSTSRRQSGSAQNVVYWGQNGGGTIENNDLSTYCTADSGIDILVLSFLYNFNADSNTATGTIGQSCFITNTGQGQNCEALSQAVTKCKAAGKKLIISLGGASSYSTITSTAEAQAIGEYLWNAYGGGSGVSRPLGPAVLDGFDFDFENSRSSQYIPDMINTLRSRFSGDSSRKYYITGAPQCPIPEPNMGTMITAATFDMLFVQFYNNNNYTYPCALPINGNAPFNYDEWVTFTSKGASKNAQLFIGVPAAPDGANGSPSGATYYATPAQLSGIVNQYKSHERFGGVMEWSAGFSDSNVANGCTYAQQVKRILTTGAPC